MKRGSTQPYSLRLDTAARRERRLKALVKPLAWALRDLLLVAGPAADDASCHAGLLPRSDCGRCSRLDRAQRVLNKVPKHFLDTSKPPRAP